MEFSADQLASLVGGTVDGDPAARVSSFAKIEDAKNGDLAFLANPKYTPFIYSTKASIVLVRDDFRPEHRTDCTMIRVADPYDTLARLRRMADEMANPQPRGIEQPCFLGKGVEADDDCYIGAFSYVGDGATLGKGVKVYPQVYVGPGASIGDGTILYAGVKVYAGCKVGRNCILHAGAVVGADGFGFAPNAEGRYDKIPQMGIVELGDNVEVGANTCIDRATMGATRIGDGTKLDNLIQVAHNVEVGSDTVVAAQAGFAGSSKVGDHCMIGGQVGVAGHIAIGNRVGIGAQSGIHASLPDGQQVMGYPAVNARLFMRQVAAMKHLPDLISQYKKLVKK